MKIAAWGISIPGPADVVIVQRETGTASPTSSLGSSRGMNWMPEWCPIASVGRDFMSDIADRRPYVAPAAPQVVATIVGAAVTYYGGSGADSGFYASYN